MKRRSLPLLMLMALKRNVDLKSIGASNDSFQRFCTDKVDCTSQTPDLCALKCVAAAAAEKESRDTATVDLPEFSLQTEANKEDEPLIIKLTGAVALLLVEYDEIKWRKHLRRENGK